MNDSIPHVEETLIKIRTYCGLAMEIPKQDVSTVLCEISRTHALMPIIDPTAYKQISANAEDNENLVNAFFKFRSEIGRIYDAAENRKGESR